MAPTRWACMLSGLVQPADKLPVQGTAITRELAVHAASLVGEFALQATPRRRLRRLIHPPVASGSDFEAVPWARAVPGSNV
eukprot:15342563-Alexandrium_andersonii.AAC.1